MSDEPEVPEHTHDSRAAGGRLHPLVGRFGHVVLSGCENHRDVIELSCSKIRRLDDDKPLSVFQLWQMLCDQKAEILRLRDAGGMMRAWIGDNEKNITDRWDSANVPDQRTASTKP